MLQREKHVDERIHRRDKRDRRLSGQLPPSPVVAGERAGGRGRRGAPVAGKPALQDHDRLGRLGRAQQIEEGTPRLDVLEIEPDRAGLRVVEIILEQFVRLDIRAVPDRDQTAEAQAAPLAALDDVGAQAARLRHHADCRSEEHTSELQSLMRISYAVFCLKKKKYNTTCRTLKKA